jgi:hypothetical protein
MAANILTENPMTGVVRVKEMLRKKAKEEIYRNGKK